MVIHVLPIELQYSTWLPLMKDHHKAKNLKFNLHIYIFTQYFPIIIEKLMF